MDDQRTVLEPTRLANEPDYTGPHVNVDYVSPDVTEQLSGVDKASSYVAYSRGTAIVTEPYALAPVSQIIKQGEGLLEGLTLYAWSGLTANAVVFIHDGRDANAPVIGIVTAKPGETNSMSISGPILFRHGLYLEMINPFTNAVLYTRKEIDL